MTGGWVVWSEEGTRIGPPMYDLEKLFRVLAEFHWAMVPPNSVQASEIRMRVASRWKGRLP